MSEDGFKISKEGLEVLDVIFKNMDAEHKMIDGWERGWRKDEVRRAEDLLNALDSIVNALTPLTDVGVTLPLVKKQLDRAFYIAEDILKNAKMKLDVHEKVYKDTESNEDDE
jgi:hypothetical protein